MRHALALILFLADASGATAQGEIDLTNVATFCAAIATADGRALDLAERRIDAIKGELDAIAELETRRTRVSADAVKARSRVEIQRRDAEALREQLSHLSPAMIEERRVVGADLTAHLDVLLRYQQDEALLGLELARLDAELAARQAQIDGRVRAALSAAEPDLRRCIGARRALLR